MVTRNNVDSTIDFNSQIYIYAPCVWQLYENSLKNKDNTWDRKQPILPDLASYYRENKSLMLHKYFKKFRMALTMQSPPMPWSLQRSRLTVQLWRSGDLWPAWLIYVLSSLDWGVFWPELGGSFWCWRGALLQCRRNPCNWFLPHSG